MGMEGNQRTTPQCYPKLCTLDQWYCDPFKIFQTSFRSLLHSKGRCSVVTINDLFKSLCSSTLNPAFGTIHFPHLFSNSTHTPSKRKPKRELPAFSTPPPKSPTRLQPYLPPLPMHLLQPHRNKNPQQIRQNPSPAHRAVSDQDGRDMETSCLWRHAASY